MTVRDTRLLYARIRAARKLRTDAEALEAELRDLKEQVRLDFEHEGVDRIIVDDVPCMVVRATERRLDTTRLKREEPDTYERFLGALVERVSVRL